MLEHPRVSLAGDADVPRRGIQVIAETVGAAQPAAGGDRTQIFQPPSAAPAAPAQPRARLLLATPGGTHVIPLESTQLTIGRGLNNDVILEDTRVSRHHAQLRYRARRFWIADIGSTNGTFVNDEQVAERSLRDGDVISLGGLELTFKES
jgi:pSer/pThr/pTyr-binding forkhead associated (FHA) protein